MDIKKICHIRGIKMKDVAERAGMTVPNLGIIMRRNPTLKRIKAVAEAIGIPPEELVKELLSED